MAVRGNGGQTVNTCHFLPTLFHFFPSSSSRTPFFPSFFRCPVWFLFAGALTSSPAPDAPVYGEINLESGGKVHWSRPRPN